MPTIRRATAADSPDVVRVIRAVYDEFGFSWDPEAYHADLYDLEGHYFAKGYPFWVAEADGQVIGTSALALFPTVPGSPGSVVQDGSARRLAGTDCALERLYVHPTARRAGAGTALLTATIAAARERRCAAMEIWSDKRFEDAHRLYGRLGAETVGDRICHDPDQSPEWGLILPL
ncbi:MAG: GNAT family N-acetyltransferase [Fimbriimonadaceae bacterium]|nr:GNAT family N-acetyltransferase [Chthonomonadaceae bacterium]MCO5297133.1 GNAT family N-acetyltransferase [Fimbriimonadaceae bacterium]